MRLTAAPGRCDERIILMGDDVPHTVPSCLSFIVAEDTTNPDIL